MRTVLFFVVLLMYSSYGVSKEIKGSDIDVKEYSVYGLKLGMKEMEALGFISKQSGIPIEKIKEQVDITLEVPLGRTTYSYEIKKYRLWLDEQGMKRLEVIFTPVWENDDFQYVVGYVDYQIPSTRENKDSSYQSAINKWGEPSGGFEFDDATYFYRAWCILNPKRKEKKQPICDVGYPQLMYSSDDYRVSIELYDMDNYKAHMFYVMTKIKENDDREAQIRQNNSRRVDVDF